MFLALMIFFMVMLRFLFWAVCIGIALALLAVAGLGLLASAVTRPHWPAHAKALREMSRGFWLSALGVSQFADAHSNWLLPNRRRA